jgi:lipid-binding SYLF domain-containing protein
MKTLKIITTACIMLLTMVAFSQSSHDKKIMNDAEMAKETLLANNKGLESYFDNASGYVIFPNVGKGGFIVGAASGNGVLYENGRAVGMADLKKLSVGLQAGGQAIIEVIFFETDAALERFKTSEYQFSAEASAVILEEGASLDADYNDGVVVFAMPKAGLMADASVGGQKFTYNAF